MSIGARRSRDTTMRPGWTRLHLQVPDAMFEAFNDARRELPGQSVKLAGTAAIALWLGLPWDLRMALYEWARYNEYHPEQLRPAEASDLLLGILSRRSDPAKGSAKSDRKERIIDLVMPPVERSGYVEQVIRSFAVRSHDADQDDDGGEQERHTA